MANTFKLEVVTPQRRLLSLEVEEMKAPGQEGEFGVLAGHTPFLTVLKPGEIVYKSGAETGVLAVSRGYAEVLPEKTTVLVDYALPESEIDADKAKADAQAAEDALKAMTQEDPAYQMTLDRLEYANARLRVKEGLKG
ncbi:MAG: ATP synthase F1 subunit epsilon [Deltaproteobacteria bacterium GWA2_55_10]|nr:MAG: ATP synthase F1 subunit epsilon [Deltaproteobacteria bacterium GWA2_55_10]